MVNTKFFNQINTKLVDSLFNNFGSENFDELRFGVFQDEPFSIKNKLRELLRKKFVPNFELNQFKERYDSIISKHSDDLNFIYNNLNESSQDIFIDVIAYRILGYKKVKLPLNNSFYRESLEKVKSLKNIDDKIDPKFNHFILEKFNLDKIGYDINLYFTDLGIVIDYIIEQYAYKINNKYVVQANKDDVVLDIGGCWADTALYFSSKIGNLGKVYSFEFIPNNINIFNKNVNLNPKLKDRITLIEQPVSNVSNQKIYYRDFGPASSISNEPFENYSGSTETITIDDFVETQKLSRLDYIKMDIEGAEPYALEGAINTIKRFRPTLAIAIYHSMDDFVNIPKWIINLDLNYNFYLGHYTIHAEETIFFAKPK